MIRSSNNSEKTKQSKSLNYSFSKLPKDLKALLAYGIFLILAMSIAIPIICLTEPKNTNVITTNSSEINGTDGLSLHWIMKGITVAGVSSEHALDDKRLSFCTGLALNSNGEVYVADYENSRVQKWSQSSKRAKTVAGQKNGVPGSNANSLNYPTKVTVDSNGNIYVTDSENHRVQLWYNGASFGQTIAGTGILINFRSQGEENYELNTPWGISLDPTSNKFYVSDSYNNRIMQYELGSSLNGTVVAGGNGPGKNRNQLFFPRGIYFDSTSNSLYITNFACNNILQWKLGESNWNLIIGNLNGDWGSTSTLLYYPSDVAIDRFGNLYVADTYNHRIQLFFAGQANGSTIAGVSLKPGVDPHSLNFPSSVAIDHDFNLFVSDSGNYRIQKFVRFTNKDSV